MEIKNLTPESFDENQSLQVIREMIQVSQKKLRNDGILFILWGWLMFYNYISSFVLRNIVISWQLRKILGYAGYVIGLLSVAFTFYYIYRQRKKVQTYIGISLRYVWISLICCLSLTSMIIHNVIHTVNFELQHPIFMMFIAFAIVITGGILRYQLIIAGGIVFGLLAYLCSYLSLQQQILIEAAAWVIAFIIPGHIMYAQRNK